MVVLMGGVFNPLNYEGGVKLKGCPKNNLFEYTLQD
jgi:hypothetical protein